MQESKLYDFSFLEDFELINDIANEKLRDNFIHTIVLSTYFGISIIQLLSVFASCLEVMMEKRKDLDYAVERFIKFWKGVMGN